MHQSYLYHLGPFHVSHRSLISFKNDLSKQIILKIMQTNRSNRSKPVMSFQKFKDFKSLLDEPPQFKTKIWCEVANSVYLEKINKKILHRRYYFKCTFTGLYLVERACILGCSQPQPSGLGPLNSPPPPPPSSLRTTDAF